MSLVTLNLAGNQFTGSLPPTLQHTTRLTTLKLNNNQLHGSINDHNIFPTLVNLLNINLSRNQLHGTLDCFMNCIHVQKLV